MRAALPLSGDSRTDLLGLLSMARCAVGAAAFAAPVTGPVLLGTDGAAAEPMAWAVRAFAGRDIAVGLLGLAAVRRDKGTAGNGGKAGSAACTAALTGALCDAGDAVTFALAVRQRQVGRWRGYLLALVSAGAAATGLVAAR